MLLNKPYETKFLTSETKWLQPYIPTRSHEQPVVNFMQRQTDEIGDVSKPAYNTLCKNYEL